MSSWVPAPSQGEVGECQQACVAPLPLQPPQDTQTLRDMFLELGCLAGPLRGPWECVLGLS